jgi:EAL domain-containing protein (putative c-di-GMP-specific phosphodiesterase class I)/CheY-like chemotaxis protein
MSEPPASEQPIVRLRVLLADDDPDMLALLGDVIAEDPRMELIGTAPDAETAVALAISERPHVAIVDVRMPGGGLAATAGIGARAPGTRVIALSSDDDHRTVISMLEAGAVGYLLKGAFASGLLESIHRAAAGGASLDGGVTAVVIKELVERRQRSRRERERRQDTTRRIERALDSPGAIAIHLQPICSLGDGSIVGVEALARFELSPGMGPDRWFADAAMVGLGTELELMAAAKAVALLDDLPAGVYLAINASPASAVSDGFGELLAGCDATRIVVEVTEVAPVEDYASFGASVTRLREIGVRLAVDDAGAGFASLRHILNLVPDVIKLDRTLIRGIEHDRARQALAAGLISFADRMEASIIAEGIETNAQRAALHALGAAEGQGYFLSRPQPAAALDEVGRRAIECRLSRAFSASL